MNFRYLQITLIFFLFALAVMFPSNHVAAQNLSCVDNDQNFYITSIVCPAARVINILVLFSGIVFSLMVVSAAYKYATSLGDPKGAMGAQATLTNAVLGFVLVIGFFVIFNILTGLFGLRAYASPTALLGQVQCGIWKIVSCTTKGGAGDPIVSLPSPDSVNCTCNTNP